MADTADTIEATYNSATFYLDGPLELAPNTRVRLVIAEVLPAEESQMSFLETMLSLKLDGPPDWSTNVDQYLYGNLQVDSDFEENGSNAADDAK